MMPNLLIPSLGTPVGGASASATTATAGDGAQWAVEFAAADTLLGQGGVAVAASTPTAAPPTAALPTWFDLAALTTSPETALTTSAEVALTSPPDATPEMAPEASAALAWLVASTMAPPAAPTPILTGAADATESAADSTSPASSQMVAALAGSPMGGTAPRSPLATAARRTPTEYGSPRAEGREVEAPSAAGAPRAAAAPTSSLPPVRASAPPTEAPRPTASPLAAAPAAGSPNIDAAPPHDNAATDALVAVTSPPKVTAQPVPAGPANERALLDFFEMLANTAPRRAAPPASTNGPSPGSSAAANREVAPISVPVIGDRRGQVADRPFTETLPEAISERDTAAPVAAGATAQNAERDPSSGREGFFPSPTLTQPAEASPTPRAAFQVAAPSAPTVAHPEEAADVMAPTSSPPSETVRVQLSPELAVHVTTHERVVQVTVEGAPQATSQLRDAVPELAAQLAMGGWELGGFNARTPEEQTDTPRPFESPTEAPPSSQPRARSTARSSGSVSVA
jgi:hypothetical protein